MAKKTPSVSPFHHHEQLLKGWQPELAYAGGDVREWQRKLRRKLRGLLGETPASKVDLHSQTTWQQEHALGRIEKITYTSEAGYDVPAYVCLPKDTKPPYRFMICVQGHSSGMHNSIARSHADETQPIEVENDRDFGLQCMARGWGALCIEQRGFGMRSQHQDYKPDCFRAAMQAIHMGRTLIGERVYDVDRGIDYLASRGDVDMKRLGLMGNSGGGTTTLFAAATLPRLSFAMPSCYFCTFADSILSRRHCACNYIPKLLRYAEMADVMGLFAPRPVVIVAGAEDDIFPLAGVRKGFRQLKKIYRAYGAEKNCRLIVGQGGHRFYADQAWPAALNMLKKI